MFYVLSFLKIKKSIVAILLLIASIWLIWCGNKRQNTQEPTPVREKPKVVINSWLDIIHGERSSQYLSGYTGQSVVITKENNTLVNINKVDYKNPVIQPWEQFLYRNEKYWFQVLLWLERKWGKIIESTPKQSILGNWTASGEIVFYITHPGFTKDNPDDFCCLSNPLCKECYFEKILTLHIYDYTTYNWYKTELAKQVGYEKMMMQEEGVSIESLTVGKNNRYYFLLTQNIFDERLKQIFQYLECEDGDNIPSRLVCPYWKNQLFLNWFSVFDVE